ncbi:DMT family transporter [Novosphingobium piscinae]|nr:EamA family transporter [Novosphingobium piscinae]
MLAMILLCVVLTAVAQLILKAGMSSASVQKQLQSGPSVQTVWTVLFNAQVFGGLVLYGLSTCLWLVVLARVDVSLAYPFVALGFVITALCGHFVYGEAMTASRIAATALICAGVALLASS